MRPHITLHMTSSLDGRTLVPRWHPADAVAPGLWQQVYDRLDIPNRIMGRTTGAETGSEQPYPKTDASFDRDDYLVGAGDKGYRVVIDTSGKLSWTGANLKGAELIVVLTEDIADSHLAGLRADNVSYIFAGQQELDLGVLVTKLREKVGIERTLLSGGPATSGAFLRAGLIDEISLLLAPTIDGDESSPTLFAGGGAVADSEFPVDGIELTSFEKLDGDMLWLRYAVRSR